MNIVGRSTTTITSNLLPGNLPLVVIVSQIWKLEPSVPSLVLTNEMKCVSSTGLALFILLAKWKTIFHLGHIALSIMRLNTSLFTSKQTEMHSLCPINKLPSLLANFSRNRASHWYGEIQFVWILCFLLAHFCHVFCPHTNFVFSSIYFHTKSPDEGP